MKSVYRLALFVFFICQTSILFSQSAGVALDNDRKAWLGINVGGFWQGSDIRSGGGVGSGFTFDYHFIRNSTSVFGIGARAQYLKSTSYGLGITRDYNIQNNPSLNGTSGNPNYASLPNGKNYVFQNYSTDVTDLSGNVIISLNRLRATSRINLYVFAGLGGTGYIAKMNQRDGSGNLYDYDLISSSGQKSTIKDELEELRDDSYETYGEGGSRRSWAFTPTIGAGFGIQLSSRVQLAIEHKVGFTGTDLLDGNGDGTNSRNDIYHYSSLGVHIGVGKLINGGPVRTRTQSNTNTTLPITESTINPPVVRITSPSSSRVTVEDCTASISAVVENITDKSSITVTHNGNPIGFEFQGRSLRVSNFRFEGSARFEISATNSAGAARRTVSFDCQPPVETITVCHHAPNMNPQTINIPLSQWSIHQAHGDTQGECPQIQTPIEMITICHQIRGASQQTLNIQVTDWPAHQAHGDTQGACPVVQPPTVTITSPSSSLVTVENCKASFTATVANITSRRDISVTQNGTAISFNFSGRTVTISDVAITGRVNFIITVKNTAGTATRNVSFVCEPKEIMICHYPPGRPSIPQSISIPESEWPAHQAHGDTQGTCPVIPPPTVSITSPTSSRVIVENCMASISAATTNITSRQNITVTQNGSPVAFDFSANTITVSNVTFTGTANFIVTVKNTSGTATRNVSFVCQPKEIIICHYPSGNTSIPQTISIPESAWTAHQAHGDTQGSCPVIQPPTVSITSPVTTPTTVEDCTAFVTATVTNISNKQDITVTQNGTPIPFDFSTSVVTVSNLAFTGNANFIITVRNSAGVATRSVSFVCQPKQITICHYPSGNTSAPQTITIPESEWATHQAHGDTQGSCPVIQPPTVSITLPETATATVDDCNATLKAIVTNITDKQEITVTQNGTPVAFDFSGNTVTVSNIAFTSSANFIVTVKNTAGTATRTVSFVCQPMQITICHYPPGNTNNPQTITIPEPEWAAHQAHGDSQGACPVIQPPTVSIISPNVASVTVEDCNAALTATVTNITDKQEITVTQSGVPVAFDFSGGTVTVSNVAFTGTANFIVTVKNSSGTATRNVSFVCQPKQITICHYPSGNTSNPQTIMIPESAWAAHQAHGDSQGACPVIQPPTVSIISPNVASVTVEDCNAALTATVTNITDKQEITVTQNGVPVAFDFSGGTVTVSNIAFTGTANFIVTVKNTAGTATRNVSFICQPKEITICHYPPGNTNNPQTITIPESAWAAHQAHGDSQGECPVIQPPTVSITSPSGASVTVEDCNAALTATVTNITNKQDVTVTQNGAPVAFDFSGSTVTVSNIAFTGTANFIVTVKNTAGTATRNVSFICQPKEITICHYPPGNTNNPQTITIPESAWAAHQAHGDSQGECPVIQPPTVSITSPSGASVTVEDCNASLTATVANITNKQDVTVTQDGTPVAFDFSGSTVKVSNIDFTGTANFIVTVKNTAGTATRNVSFVCNPKQITICHYPPGNTDNPQTITIPESAWAAHKGHGDSLGECVVKEKEEENKPEEEAKGEETEKIEICHHPPGNRENFQTITISASAWPAHEKHGDTKGPCKD